MNKVILFLERMWLTVAIVSVGIAIYRAITGSMQESYYFLLFAALATVLFLLRRRTRKRMDQSVNREE